MAPPLRASALTTGIRKTRSAPSGRRCRPVWSWIDDHRHQAVDRDRAGVVGDDQGAALGRDVLDAADLDPEPLLGDRAQRGHEEALGDLGVEAVLVDDVVAGHPAAQEGQERGRAAAPTGRRTPPWRRAGTRPASRRRGCRRAASRSLGGRGGRGRRRGAAARPVGRRRPAAVPRAARLGRLRRRRPLARLRRCGLAALGRPGCGRRTTAVLAGAAARAAAGADRDDLGVTHGAAPELAGLRRASSARVERRRAPGSVRPPVGGSGAAKSANASAVVYAGSKPSSVAHPGGVDARGRR